MIFSLAIPEKEVALYAMSLKRFGVSLEDELLKDLDQYAADNGFANRSQAIRFLIEKNVTEQKWQCNHIVAGTVVIMYDLVKKDITAKIATIQQEYTDVILSSSQYFVNADCSMYVVTVLGEAHRLTELSDRLTTIKGVRHGKLVMSRAD
jgi:CopG family nickel-responsive transcriptional regulator